MNRTCPIRIITIFTSPGHDFKGHHGQPRGHHPTLEHESVSCVAHQGIVGDRYFDRRPDDKGQITFFDWATVLAVRERFGRPDLDAALFRRNVVIEGVDLNSLVCRVFEIAGIRFEGAEECAPCYWMNEAIAPGAEAFLQHRGGLRARILAGGTLRRGTAQLIVFSA